MPKDTGSLHDKLKKDIEKKGTPLQGKRRSLDVIRATEIKETLNIAGQQRDDLTDAVIKYYELMDIMEKNEDSIFHQDALRTSDKGLPENKSSQDIHGLSNSKNLEVPKSVQPPRDAAPQRIREIVPQSKEVLDVDMAQQKDPEFRNKKLIPLRHSISSFNIKYRKDMPVSNFLESMGDHIATVCTTDKPQEYQKAIAWLKNKHQAYKSKTLGVYPKDSALRVKFNDDLEMIFGDLQALELTGLTL